MNRAVDDSIKQLKDTIIKYCNIFSSRLYLLTILQSTPLTVCVCMSWKKMEVILSVDYLDAVE